AVVVVLDETLVIAERAAAWLLRFEDGAEALAGGCCGFRGGGHRRPIECPVCRLRLSVKVALSRKRQTGRGVNRKSAGGKTPIPAPAAPAPPGRSTSTFRASGHVTCRRSRFARRS